MGQYYNNDMKIKLIMFSRSGSHQLTEVFFIVFCNHMNSIQYFINKLKNPQAKIMKLLGFHNTEGSYSKYNRKLKLFSSTQSRGMASELGYNSLSALTSALVPLTLSGGASSAADSVAGSLVSTPDTSPLTGINSHFTQDK